MRAIAILLGLALSTSTGYAQVPIHAAHISRGEDISLATRSPYRGVTSTVRFDRAGFLYRVEIRNGHRHDRILVPCDSPRALPLEWTIEATARGGAGARVSRSIVGRAADWCELVPPDVPDQPLTIAVSWGSWGLPSVVEGRLTTADGRSTRVHLLVARTDPLPIPESQGSERVLDEVLAWTREECVGFDAACNQVERVLAAFRRYHLTDTDSARQAYQELRRWIASLPRQNEREILIGTALEAVLSYASQTARQQRRAVTAFAPH